MPHSRLLVTALLGTTLIGATEARGTFTFTVEQVGTDVVVTGSGTLNLTALSFFGSGTTGVGVIPSDAVMISGTSGGSVDAYGGFSGPGSFGSGSTTLASSGTGDTVLMDGLESLLAVPTGYVSGNTLSTTAVFDGATFGSLGLTPGTYTWTWGSALNGSADSFVIDIVAPTPEPASLLLIGVGLAGIGAIRRHRL